MTMTTMTLETTASVRRLEELVDRLLGDNALVDAAASSLTRAVHEARRLRQSGCLDAALAMLAEVDSREATEAELRWLYAEWLDIARRRFGDTAMLYSPATGRAAVVVPTGEDNATLEVVVALGMRWPVGKTISRRSLRGLKPLVKGSG